MPVTPNNYEALASQMLKLYVNSELSILSTLSKRLNDGTSLPVNSWKAQKLSEIRKVKRELKTAIKQLKSGRSDIADALVGKSYAYGKASFETELRAALGTAGTKLGGNTIKAARILSELSTKLAASDRVILRKTADQYASIVGNSASMVANGSITLKAAVKREVEQFANKGIVNFVDKSGGYWEMSTYAEMATLTAIERSTIAGYTDAMASYGFDLAVISSHGDSCPICSAWEGVVVSVSGDTKGYSTLGDAESAGVFHPRCRHDLATYYEDITESRGKYARSVGEPSSASTNRTTQRYLERQVRKWKRRQVVSVDALDELAAHDKVVEYQGSIRKLVKGKGLIRNYAREGGTVKLSESARGIGRNSR